MIALPKITVISDFASPALAAKIAQVNPERLAAQVAPILGAFWRDRLKSLPPNKRFPDASTGFWEDQAASVIARNSGGSITVSAGTGEGGIVLQYHGGTVTPQQKKALTIPVSSESYGKRASDFENLILIQTKKGAYLAQSSYEHTGTVKGGKNKGQRTRRGHGAAMQRQHLTFLFKLVASATIPPNPKVMPTEEEFAEVVISELERRMETNA